jgi:hypothetical protein
VLNYKLRGSLISHRQFSWRARCSLIVVLLAGSVFLGQNKTFAQQPATATGAPATSAAQPGFSIQLTPVDSTRLPDLHSYSVAEADGKWLIFGGRTNGLHLFVQSVDGTTPPPNAFPPSQANRKAWVIDPVAKKAWSVSVDGLPAPVADQLSATNAEYKQDGNTLYIVGGYGLDSKSNQMTTFSSLIAVKVSEAINAIISNKPLAPFLQQTNLYFDCVLVGTNTYNSCYNAASNNCKTGPGWEQCMKNAQSDCQKAQDASQNACIRQVQSGSTKGLPTNDGYYSAITGGGLEKAGNVFYLVFGQQFAGLYSVLEGDYGKWPVKQVYAERIALFQFTPDPLQASLLKVIQQDANDLAAEYHRRDLNVVPALNPNGDLRIAAYGGVFVPGRDSAYREPVFIDNGADPAAVKVTIDKTHQQVMSQYDCATLNLFDRSTKTSATIFFGGISLYYLDPKTHKLRMDEGLPFVDSLSVMSHYADSSWSEFVRSVPLSGFMGADAKFLPRPGLASKDGVIYLDGLKQKTLVGYVYGGILADQPEAGGATGNHSRASNALYEVWLDPTPPAPTYWVPATVN